MGRGQPSTLPPWGPNSFPVSGTRHAGGPYYEDTSGFLHGGLALSGHCAEYSMGVTSCSHQGRVQGGDLSPFPTEGTEAGDESALTQGHTGSERQGRG